MTTDKIPDDLREKAEAVSNRLFRECRDPVGLIAQALAAERERCEKIVARAAKKWANGKKCIGDGTHPAEILNAIRSPS